MKPVKLLFALFLTTVLFSPNSLADQVLVIVGDGEITESQLDQALQAAPFATQFPAMDEQDQAYLRGDMLMRLAQSEALYQEARQLKLDQQQNFIKDRNDFTTGLMAQRYLSGLSDKIEVPDAINEDLSNVQDHNARSAARSAYTAKQFKHLKQQAFAELKDKYQVEIFLTEAKQAFDQETVLAQSTGFIIKYSDLTQGDKPQEADLSDITKLLDTKLQTLLFAHEAENLGIEVESQAANYSRQLLIQTLLENLEKQWIASDQTLSDYFQRHPKLGYIPERRQIGQIVVAEKQLAEHLRNRILGGASLFRLAAEYSIDPYGKKQAGNMGWLKENSASPAIETALTDLPDNTVSDIIKTAKGYHLVMIIARKPAEQKGYAEIKDRVRQALINEKMTPYLEQLMVKHSVKWQFKNRAITQ